MAMHKPAHKQSNCVKGRSTGRDTESQHARKLYEYRRQLDYAMYQANKHRYQKQEQAAISTRQ